MERSSGILMHISSLSGRNGIGSVGNEAYRFIDFLKLAGQKYWQILPLGHTSYGDSPYQCFSAFAGNPHFIDFELLMEDGLLKEKDYVNRNFGENKNEVNYGIIFEERQKVFKIAYKNFKKISSEEFKLFKEENKFWLEEYSFYMAVKESFKLKSWQEWDEDIRTRIPLAVEKYKFLLSDKIEYWNFIQFEFFKQWNKLKAYANKNNVSIIGDIPIYVAEDGSDIWANPKMFKIDKNLTPTVISGCPPDSFSETGQLWGNPIYDWDEMEKDNYSWWVLRIKESFKLYDVVRIDHFRGFEAYWEIPCGDTTAENGKWVKGPAMKLINAIKSELGDLDIIAEDLGYLTDEVLEFKKESGYPGMKILQFAFGGDDSAYLPHNYPIQCVAYTGTHDNDTVKGWMEKTGSKEEVENAIKYLPLTIEEGYNFGFIRGVWSSVSYLAIAPMQDFLILGNDARTNLPSTLGGNWKWRAKEEDLNTDLAKRIYELTKRYGRN
ncbi:MAG: 4-alpha-glucanotransferase [Clostridium sp.]